MNDTDAAVLSEIHFEIPKNLRNFVLITLGTAGGKSTVIIRKIFIRHYDLASEPGPTKIYKDSRPCSCVKRGCLEKYLSWNGIKSTVFTVVSTQQKYGELREHSFLYLSPKTATDPALLGDAIAIKAH